MTAAKTALSRARQIDLLCDEFETQWRAGLRPQIEDYVARGGEEDDDNDLRAALVAIERELRERSAADTSVTQSSLASQKEIPSADTTIHRASSSQTLPTAIGRFAMRSLLGCGAFGQVYRAFDPELGREVAIKIPLPSIAGSGDEKQRFLKEARAVATINHPNVCQIHEVGEQDGRPYLVMPLIEGESLAETLKRRQKPLEPRQVALIIRKIALALAAAHAKGIVHRDLKPANIMFDRERKDILVMDFGLARGPQLGPAGATHSGVVMGTPAYMSPEQARGESKEVGPAGDIYSLGVVLYELLTGTRPYNGTATEVIGQILHVEPEAPSRRLPTVDPRLEAACLKAMAKDPAARFSSMKEFAAAMEAILKPPGDLAEATETARADGTQTTVAVAAANMSDLFAALSADRQAQDAATRAAVQAELRRSRTPPALIGAIGLLMAFGFIALGGILFYTRSDKIRVTVELADVDLTDKSLSFLLDDRPISAEELSREIELAPGTHLLLVKRGKAIVKRMRLTVTGGLQRGIKVKDITPPALPPVEPPSEPMEQPAKIVWQPLIRSSADLIPGETATASSATRAVRFRDGRLELRGPNASYHPKFSAKNYILRAKIHQFSGQNVLFVVRREPGRFGGYGAFFNCPDPRIDWPAYGLGKRTTSKPWQDIRGTMLRVSDQFPVDFAVAAFGEELSIYVNNKRVLRCTDKEAFEGQAEVVLTGDSHATLSDLEVCVLDGTKLTPDDVFPQKVDQQVERLLSPEYLTAERKEGNLLRNGSFEEASAGPWKMESWRNRKESCRILPDRGHDGERVLMIQNLLSDDVSYKQTVSVKPLTRYLLSGWIKTHDVERKSHSGAPGAHLYVWGGHEWKSPSVTYTNDWTYYAVVFRSGTRTSVEIAARLGYFAGDITGTAWFDDLCLIELPDSEQ
jgi:hypothetical protein